MSAREGLGIGFLSVTHPHVYTRADILVERPDVRLEAVWDEEDPANARVFADRYHVDVATTSEELLARDDIDAVIVESWTANMAPFAVKALEAGKAVLLEKPGANSPEAMRSVADAVERTGGYLTVGYMVRQAASHSRLKTMLSNGDLGRVTAARFHVSVPAPDAVTPWFNLTTDPGGVLYEDGCHMIDMILDLFGRPTSVTAQISKFDDLAEQHGHMHEDVAVCTLTWPDKAATLTVVGWEANDWLETWEAAVFGVDGTAFAGPLPDRLHVFRKSDRGEQLAGWSRHDSTQFNVSWLDHDARYVWHAVQHRSFFRAELDRFLSDVRDGGTPMIPASHALDVIETTFGLYRSASEGRVITL